MYESLEFSEQTKAAVEENVLQKCIFFKIAVLQSIKLIAWSKSLKITSEKVHSLQL